VNQILPVDPLFSNHSSSTLPCGATLIDQDPENRDIWWLRDQLEGKRMNFSVVIPTHNRKELLRRCVEAVVNQDVTDYEVIVVSDASSDGTSRMVRNEFPNVHFLDQYENRGPAAARNRGIDMARGEIIAFTDDDCEPPADWLSSLKAGFAKHPNAGAIGGIQEPPESVWRHNVLARYERFITRTIYGVGRTDVTGQPAPGGTNNLAIRKSILDDVGCFDESFPVAAGEDADLLHRIADAGYTSVTLPLAVTHHQTYTWSSFFRQQVRRGIGAAYFHHKRGHLYPLNREIARLVATPILFLQHLAKYRSPAMSIVDTLGGLCQTWGRLRARQTLRRTVSAKLWQSAPSPTKLRYIDQYAIGATALDIGTGSGFYARYLSQSGFHVTSTDVVKLQQTRHRFTLGRLRKLPFDRKFDTVLCFDVLEHEQQESQAIDELKRVVGKRLLLSVPNEDDSLLHAYNLTYKHHIDKTHIREYSRQRLRELLEGAGFRILAIQGEGPVHPAVFAELVRPRILQGPARLVLKILHRFHILGNPDLMADIYVVAEPKE